MRFRETDRCVEFAHRRQGVVALLKMDKAVVLHLLHTLDLPELFERLAQLLLGDV